MADGDGCPDRGGRQWATLSGDRVSFRRPIKFDRRNKPRRGLAGTTILKQLSRIMVSHPEVSQWLLVVAAKKRRGGDDATRAASQAQANAVKAYLVKAGVPAEVIQAVGAVSPKPTVGVVIRERKEVDETEAAPVLVCPAEMKVVPREPSAPAAQ